MLGTRVGGGAGQLVPIKLGGLRIPGVWMCAGSSLSGRSEGWSLRCSLRMSLLLQPMTKGTTGSPMGVCRKRSSQKALGRPPICPFFKARN